MPFSLFSFRMRFFSVPVIHLLPLSERALIGSSRCWEKVTALGIQTREPKRAWCTVQALATWGSEEYRSAAGTGTAS